MLRQSYFSYIAAATRSAPEASAAHWSASTSLTKEVEELQCTAKVSQVRSALKACVLQHVGADGRRASVHTIPCRWREQFNTKAACKHICMTMQGQLEDAHAHARSITRATEDRARRT